MRLLPLVLFFLAGLTARHDFAKNTTVGFSHETISADDLDGFNAAEHPVIRVHPDSGRKCLFVNPGNTSHISGLTPAESALLLDFFYEHSTAAESIYRHAWSINDLVIWDNRCTMHYAISDYDEDRYAALADGSPAIAGRIEPAADTPAPPHAPRDAGVAESIEHEPPDFGAGVL